MPLTAWLGLTQSPGEIAGFGPVTRQTSRTLADRIGASLRSRWCLTLTDAAGHAIGHGCARRPPPGGADSDRIADWLASLKIGRMEAGVCSHAREVPRYRIPGSLHHIVKTRQRTCSARAVLALQRAAMTITHVPTARAARAVNATWRPLIWLNDVRL